MTPEVTNCYDCKHSLELHGIPPVCKAFPKGIPEVIIYDGTSHENIHPGQTGEYVFEKRVESSAIDITTKDKK